MRKLVANNHTQFQEMADALRRFSTVRLERETSGQSRTKPKNEVNTVAPADLKVRSSIRNTVPKILIPMQRDVRRHSLLLLGRKDRKSQVPAPPHSEAIKRFNQTGEGGPEAKSGLLRLDLEGPVGSTWNLYAARCFREHFLKSGLYKRWPEQAIETAFLRHTLTIRSHYLRQRGAVTDHDLSTRRVKAARRTRLRAVGSQSSDSGRGVSLTVVYVVGKKPASCLQNSQRHGEVQELC